MITLNRHIDIDLFEIQKQTQHLVLEQSHETSLINLVTRLQVLPKGETVIFIRYLLNKRGFVISVGGGKFYFMRPLFKTNISLVYLSRLLIGQPHCCAKAHALGQGLPSRSMDTVKYMGYDSDNLLPCVICFEETTEHSYRITRGQHISPVMQGCNTSNVNALTARALVYLLTNDDLSLIEKHEDEWDVIYTRTRDHSIQSTTRSLQALNDFGNIVIGAVDAFAVNEADRVILGQVESTMESSLRLALAINATPPEQLTIDKCCDFAEAMSRLRNNLQNMAFTLRYAGHVDVPTTQPKGVRY